VKPRKLDLSKLAFWRDS